MEGWDGWQAEIQERLAELTDEHSSPEPLRERRWVRLVRLVRTNRVTRFFRAFLSDVKRAGSSAGRI
jgi:hypothetical protein